MNLNIFNKNLQPKSLLLADNSVHSVTKPRAGRVVGFATALVLTVGALTACDTASTSNLSAEWSPSPTPTESVETITAAELLPNVEVIRASLDETKYQIPYRDDYTADTLARLSMNRDFDIREMFKGNTKLLVDDLDKWWEVEFVEQDGASQLSTYAKALVEVQIAVAKDNVLSSNYFDNLEPGGYNYLDRTISLSGFSVVLNELKAIGQGKGWDISGELVEGSATIRYLDDGRITSSYTMVESFDTLNDMAANSAREKFEITYVNEDGLLKIETVEGTDL